MSRLTLLVCLSCLTAAVYAQDAQWQWAVSAGDAGYEIAESVVCDASGNVYATGYYQGSVQFGNWSSDSGDDMEIFVVKYDPQGNFLWVQHAGSPYNDSAEDIAIDAEGNVYITGWFQNVATFGSLGVVSLGSSDIYIAKLDPNGNWVYVNGAGGLDSDRGYSIATCGDGHVYVAGNMYEEAFFGDYSIECDYLADLFVAEADENGNWLWAEWAGGRAILRRSLRPRPRPRWKHLCHREHRTQRAVRRPFLSHRLDHHLPLRRQVRPCRKLALGKARSG